MIRRTAGLVVFGAGLIVIANIVLTSLDRNAYFLYPHEDRTSWEHPTLGVALVCLMAALETAVTYGVLVLRRPGRLWMRALVGLAALVPWGAWIGMMIMHSPFFWIIHVLWVWFLIAALALAGLCSGLLHVYSGLRERRTASA